MAYFLIDLGLELLELDGRRRSHGLHDHTGQVALLLVGERDVHLIEDVGGRRVLLLHDLARQVGVERNVEQVDRRLEPHEVVQLRVGVPDRIGPSK